MKDNIAVIIAAYNAEKYIERCVKSIQRQSYEKWEAYIVNDGSLDNTLMKLRDLQKEDKRIKIFDTYNGGVFRARRIAIDSVENCKYMTFLDSDDYFCDDFLFEKCIKKMYTEEIDCLGFNYCINNKLGFKVKKEKYWTEKEIIIGNMLKRECLDGNMPYAMYSTEIVKEYFKVYDYNNDDFFNKYEIMMHSNKVAYVPWCGYTYYVNKKSQTRRPIREIDYLYFEHAKKFTDTILEKYPELKEECNYFLCWVLLWVALQLEKGKKCKKFEMYMLIRDSLKRYSSVYIYNPYFSVKERITYILIKLHMFRILYRIYHVLKG